uniref:acyltransferase n=1 Tax=Agathobacter sp. TaxID=2021311 RepID=UPI00405718FF
MKKVSYISVLSVISALAVVMLHTNDCFWHFSNERYWVTANIIESVMYFAVPIFFMISGATLMEYRERYSTREYFKKRISKAVVPFILWNLVGLAYGLWQGHIRLEEVSLVGFIENSLNNKIVPIYWFFIPLFSIYMSIPVLSAIPKEHRKHVFCYMSIVSFGINILLPFIFSVFGIAFNGALQIGVASGYLFYVIIGYLLHNYALEKKLRYVIYILGIIGLCMHIVGTYKLSVEAGQIVSTFKGYVNIPCVLYSIAVFVFVKELVGRYENTKIVSFILKFNKYTFAVYLMHFFVMDMLVDSFEINTFSIYYRVIGACIIFLICCAVTKILRKIPFGTYLLP